VIDDHPIVHAGVVRWVAEASIPTGTVPAYRSVATQVVDIENHRPRSIAAAIIAGLAGLAGLEDPSAG